MFQTSERMIRRHQHLRSKLFMPCRESPPRNDEAQIISHKLMLQAGYIRRVAPGIFASLPLMQRVMTKLIAIVDDEMHGIDCQRLTMPNVLPSSLWLRSGRWHTAGDEMWRLKDRRHAEFCLGPTHEEAFSSIVAEEIAHVSSSASSTTAASSLRLYQISTKYRDEIRPRFGLMRGREFLMKDLYTFDNSQENALRTYNDVVDAYRRVFDRIGLKDRYCMAQADTGTIGGDYSHEFHVLAAVGEDEILKCNCCGYVANSERAESVIADNGAPLQTATLLVTEHAADADASAVSARSWRLRLVWPRGRALNDTAMRRAALQHADVAAADRRVPLTYRVLGVASAKAAQRAADDADPSSSSSSSSSDSSAVTKQQQQHSAAPDVVEAVLFDRSIASSRRSAFLVAANDDDGDGDHTPHYGAESFVLTRAGDRHACSNSAIGGVFESHRGIEIGQAFLLGSKYSKPFNILLKHPITGQFQFSEMGCYGLGMGRITASVIEVYHDAHGIRWPTSIAPYAAVVLIASMDHQSVVDQAHLVSSKLQAIGSGTFHDNVLLDDRTNVALKVKIREAMIAGFPWIVIVGHGTVRDSIVEVIDRHADDGANARKLSIDQLMADLSQH